MNNASRTCSNLAQIGLVIFCTFMTITADKHGGVHEWNLSKTQVQKVLFVSGS
jgi:hypothetical protein